MKFCHQGIIRQENIRLSRMCQQHVIFYAMAAINGGVAKAAHVHFDSSQGDVRFLRVLEKMGCTVTDEPDGICLRGPEDGILHGVDVVMSDFSDQTMTLAATAVLQREIRQFMGWHISAGRNQSYAGNRQ